MAYSAGYLKAGDPEPTVKDPRFSREHEIDEAEFRKAKAHKGVAKLDTPADETPTED